MTDRERYQRTFSTLHASPELNLEVSEMKMNRTKKRHITKAAAICAAAVIAATIGTVGAYAADVGGIQRKVQIWLNGEQTDAVLEIEPGFDADGTMINEDGMTKYTLTYEDENGEKHERQGGGIAMDKDGNPVQITEEDIMAQIDTPEVLYNDDGTIVVSYHGQNIDITDKFDEDDFCYVTVNTDPVTYMTIKKNDGYASSTIKYPDWED